MPRRAKVTAVASAQTSKFRRYWAARVRSPAFQRELAAMLAGEIRSLANDKVGDLVDGRRIRERIARSDRGALDERIAAELAFEVARALGKELGGKNRRLRDLLGDDAGDAVESLVAERRVLRPPAERRIGAFMHQRLVRELLTDVVHDSIVAFYKRINPIFGGVAMMALEGQIKGFIRLFMPMILDRATAFIVDRNQEVFAELARSIARGLLEAPLPEMMSLVSAGNPKTGRALARELARSPALDALGRDLTLAAWDAVFARIREEKVGDVLRLEENADAWAADAVALLLPVVVRPRVVDFLERELLLATNESAAEKRPQPPRKGRRPTTPARAPKSR